MNEKYLLPSLGLLIIVLLLGFAGIVSIQNRQNARVVQSLDSLAAKLERASFQENVPANAIRPVAQPSTSATVPAQAQDAPMTIEQLRARLALTDWTELYVATSAKGQLAIAQLNDLRSGQKKLSSAAASELQANGLQTAEFSSDGSIALGRCDEQLMSSLIRDGEYSPGMRTIYLFTTAPAFSKNGPQITYLATDIVMDTAGNRVPVLHGPYNGIKANELIDAFATLRCKDISELK